MHTFINLRETLNHHKNMKAVFQESLHDKADIAYCLLVNQIQARQRSKFPVTLTKKSTNY